MSPPSTDITGSKLVEHHTLPQTVPWMGHCHRHEEQGYQIAPLKERTFKIGQPHPSFSCTPQSCTKTTLGRQSQWHVTLLHNPHLVINCHSILCTLTNQLVTQPLSWIFSSVYNIMAPQNSQSIHVKQKNLLWKFHLLYQDNLITSSIYW